MPSNLSNCKFCARTKIPKYGIKIVYWSDLGSNFENTTVIFEVSVLKFDLLQSFV